MWKNKLWIFPWKTKINSNIIMADIKLSVWDWHEHVRWKEKKRKKIDDSSSNSYNHVYACIRVRLKGTFNSWLWIRCHLKYSRLQNDFLMWITTIIIFCTKIAKSFARHENRVVYCSDSMLIFLCTYVRNFSVWQAVFYILLLLFKNVRQTGVCIIVSSVSRYAFHFIWIGEMSFYANRRVFQPIL